MSTTLPTASTTPQHDTRLDAHVATHLGRPPRKRPHERTEENELYARQFPVHVGVDCGRTFHKLVARGPDGRRLAPVTVPVSRAGFEAADQYLTERFTTVERSGRLVAFEFAGHYGLTFAEFLRAQGYALVSVRSDVTKRLKEVEDNSPQKDDDKDAAQICKLLSTGYFVPYSALSDLVAEMRVLATERVRLSKQITQTRNHLHSVLDLAWPEFVTLFSNLTAPTPRALLARWPVPDDLLAVSVRTVHALVRRVSQNHLPLERTKALYTSARESIALPTATAARRAEIQRILIRWDLVEAQLAAIDTRLEALVDQHPGAKALTTIPGVKAVCAATLIAELGTPESYESPRQVLKLAGLSLAGPQSGTSVRGRVRITKRGRPLLRRQLFLLGGRWCQRTGLYRDYYLALRQRHGEAKVYAICAVARKLVPLLLHVLQSGEPFDEARWRAHRHVDRQAA